MTKYEYELIIFKRCREKLDATLILLHFKQHKSYIFSYYSSIYCWYELISGFISWPRCLELHGLMVQLLQLLRFSLIDRWWLRWKQIDITFQWHDRNKWFLHWSNVCKCSALVCRCTMCIITRIQWVWILTCKTVCQSVGTLFVTIYEGF